MPFARYLLEGVLRRYGPGKVAVLWVSRQTNYTHLWPAVELWGVLKDARLYQGPYPIIAHPPCGPWGMMKHWSKESKEHGIKAMELVHKYGGVVEQPLGSSLFREFGDGRALERIDQCLYGHPMRKRTLLYWV